MDIEFLKTFLEVNRTRHFGKAADNLFVTQSTVSSRVKQLEDSLGAAVFTRTRNAIELTPTGKRLLSYAENIVTTWNRARIETAIEDQEKIPLTIAGMPSLWDIALQEWLCEVTNSCSDYVLQIDVLSQENITSRLRNAMLDLGFVFDIPAYKEIDSVEVDSIPLILVSSKEHDSITSALQDDYILIDWGTSFAITHAKQFPDIANPALRIGLGRIAKEVLLSRGGCAYMPEPMVMNELNTGRLHMVKHAPVIKRSFYAAWPANSDKFTIIEKMLAPFPFRRQSE